MNYWDGHRVAVDPIGLAMRSGVLPRVGLHGMGGTAGDVANFDPEPISRSALQIVDQIQSWFGGGAHLIADKITPTQQRITDEVIAPIVAVIFGPDATRLSTSQIDSLQGTLNRTHDMWEQLLHAQGIAGTIAAQHAESDMARYFTDQTARLNALRANAPGIISTWIDGSPTLPDIGMTDGGVVNSGTGTASMGFSTLLPAVLAGLAILYFSKKSKVSR